jgi:hypothetical protein
VPFLGDARGTVSDHSAFRSRFAAVVNAALLNKEVHAVIRWKMRYLRVAIALGALASFLVASGAGARWS